ncbi:MAG: hypothetical protein HDS31_01755 [Bacteroides sp.]|nr:hypothetical protein [Bacteroides sp.]
MQTQDYLHNLIARITKDKIRHNRHPANALESEILAEIRKDLDARVRDGLLTRSVVSVNKIPAYSIPI